MNFPSLDFTNYREHPSDNRYQVFFFKTPEESAYFGVLLKENNIEFEYHHEEGNPTYPYYFAVNKLEMNVVKTLNHLTIGKFRKPFIGNNILRIFLFILMIVVMTLAVIGFIKNG